MASPRDAMITGVGLVSCLGEGIEAHWSALNRDGGFVLTWNEIVSPGRTLVRDA